MNGFLLLGSKSLILKSADAVTWAQVNHDGTANGMVLSAFADDGSGHLVTTQDGSQGPADVILTSADDGVTWAPTKTSPVGVQNSVATFNGFPLGGRAGTLRASLQAGNAVWDGSQFVLIADNAASPFLDLFSTTGGATWTAWAQTDDVTHTYVPEDLLFFKGIYVGYVNTNPNFSLMWSPTAGRGAGPVSPGTSSDWTVGQVLPGAFQPFFKTNGSYILAFGATDGGGNNVVYKSTDGKAWTVSGDLNGQFILNGKDSVYWDSALALWILGAIDNGGQGLFTSTDGLVWTKRLYDPTFTTFAFNSIRRTGWFLSAVGVGGIFYISTDGITWTAINAACGTPFDHWDLSFIHSIDNYFVALGSNNNSPFQQALLTSANGLNWTNRQDVTAGSVAYNLVGPATSVLTSYIDPCTGKVVPNPNNTPGMISGDLIGFTFNEEQGVTAWHRHPMIGGVKSIACIPAPSKSQDDLWMIVERTVNNVTKQYVEFMAPHFVTGDDMATDALYSDSGVTYNGASTKTITGLGHLEGLTVKVLTDGALHPDCVVASGQITLQWPAKIVQVGLQQVARLTTMPIEAGATTGTAQGKVKRITDVTIRFLNTLGGKIGREDPDKELSDPPETVMDNVEMRDPDDPMSQALVVYNGLWPEETYAFNFPGGYEVEGRLTYLNEEPLPATIVGIYPNLDSED